MWDLTVNGIEDIYNDNYEEAQKIRSFLRARANLDKFLGVFRE